MSLVSMQLPRAPSCPDSVTRPLTTLRLTSRGSSPVSRHKSVGVPNVKVEEGNGCHLQGANPENPCSGPDDRPLGTRRLISRGSSPVCRHRSVSNPDAIAEKANGHHTQNTHSGFSSSIGLGDPCVHTSPSSMRHLEQEERLISEDSNVSERDGKVQFRWTTIPKLPRSSIVPAHARKSSDAEDPEEQGDSPKSCLPSASQSKSNCGRGVRRGRSVSPDTAQRGDPKCRICGFSTNKRYEMDFHMLAEHPTGARFATKHSTAPHVMKEDKEVSKTKSSEIGQNDAVQIVFDVPLCSPAMSTSLSRSPAADPTFAYLGKRAPRRRGLRWQTGHATAISGQATTRWLSPDHEGYTETRSLSPHQYRSGESELPETEDSHNPRKPVSPISTLCEDVVPNSTTYVENKSASSSDAGSKRGPRRVRLHHDGGHVQDSGVMKAAASASAIPHSSEANLGVDMSMLGSANNHAGRPAGVYHKKHQPSDQSMSRAIESSSLDTGVHNASTTLMNYTSKVVHVEHFILQPPMIGDLTSSLRQSTSLRESSTCHADWEMPISLELFKPFATKKTDVLKGLFMVANSSTASAPPAKMLCEMLPKHLAIYDLMQLDSPAYKIHILDIQAECTGREGILQLRTPLDPCNGTCKVKRRIEKGELYLYTRDYEEASKWARELRLRCVHLLAMPENERFEVCDIPIALRQTSDPVVQTSTL